MFIPRKAYDALKDQIAALRESLASAAVSADFLRVRVNQLELENAGLRFDLTGKPQRAAIVDRIENPNAVDHPNAPLDFEDMGDEKAGQLGVGWDAEGRVKYSH